MALAAITAQKIPSTRMKITRKGEVPKFITLTITDVKNITVLGVVQV
jgi:hypothetical protein